MNEVLVTHTYSPILERSEWQETLQKGQVYLIEENGIVVGNVSYVRESDDHAYLSDLAIHPNHQGKGLGRRTLGTTLHELRDVRKINLATHPDNPARALYESFGFVVTERKENHFGDGEPRLILELSKQ